MVATETTPTTLDRALSALAYGRIALGATALAAPRTAARLALTRPTPELGYMTRIFGARALALGLGYLTAAPADRPRWQRLALMVDVLDTASGTAHVVRGDIHRGVAAALVALTGGYATIGARRFLRDRLTLQGTAR
ncbi:hypothetical protein ABZV58_00930 [Nocardia sp. NPDC004654]|uniref:hypothetical protein n=1 Tax=Nocardia sp. NPDC004654 TaxID=3154776 RepID=UPI00339F1AA9